MQKDSHKLRDNMRDLNQNDDALFKIENDPRLLNGANLHF